MGPSVQLAIGRLQLQEQRINTLVDERTSCVTRSPRRTSGPARCGTVWEIFSERWKTALTCTPVID